VKEEEKMQVNVNVVLVDLDGDPIKDAKKAADGQVEYVDVTLKRICVNALLAAQQDEKLDGLESVRRFNLARKINGAKDGQLKLSAEDISKVKSLIGKSYAPLVTGQAWELLEGGQAEVGKAE
jgi:hypothetical protein